MSRWLERGTFRFLLLLAWLVGVLAVALWRVGALRPDPGEYMRRAENAAGEGRLDKAVSAARRAVEADSTLAGAWSFKGHRELELNRPDSAVRSFRRAVEADAALVEAKLGLARAHLNADRPDSAAALLTRIPPVELSDRRQQLRRARMLAEAGAVRHALAAYTRLTTIDGVAPEILTSATRVAAAAEEWGAVLWFSRRLEQAAEDGESLRVALRHRAIAQEALGATSKALAAYRQIPSPENLEKRASLADRVGADSLAAALYWELVERSGDEPRFRLKRAAALERAGRPGEAAEVYAGLREDGALSQDAAVRYAWLLRARGRPDEAWRVLRPHRPTPTDAGEVRLWVSTALDAGALDQARALAERHLSENPESAADWRLLARVERTAGELEAAASSLERYLNLRPGDAAARTERIGLLANLGRREEAVDEARRLLLEHPPRTPDVFARVGRQMEQLQAWGIAVRAYRKGLVAAGGDQPDLRLREAEATLLARRPREAAARYRMLLERSPPPEIARRGRLGLARALLAADRPAEALGVLGPPPEPLPGTTERSAKPLDIPVPVYGVQSADTVRLRLLARAAGEADSASTAVRSWEALATTRSLTEDDWAVLAGLYRRAGRHERARRVYEALVALADRRGHEPSHDFLQAVGNLRLRTGHPTEAAEAYGRLPATRLRESRAGLNLARALWQSGRREGALEQYLSWLQAHPNATGQVKREVARAHLSAGRHAGAEQWAREALEEDPDDRLARLLLAESLRFQGEVQAADRLADRLRGTRPPARMTRAEWSARLSRIGDRYLAAYRGFGRAAAADTGDAGALLVARARAAASRGDYARAARALQRADSAGASAARLEDLRRQLDRATRTGATGLGGLFIDSNDLKHLQWLGLRGSLWARDRARLFAGLQGATLSQGEASFDRWRVTLGADSLFPTSSVHLDMWAGLSAFSDVDLALEGTPGDADEILTGGVRLRAAVRDATRLALTFERQSVWEATGAGGPRQFNRVTALASLPPEFSETSVGLGLEHVVGANGRVSVGVGATRLDGGRAERVSATGRYEARLVSGPDRYLSVAPNFYAEGTPPEVAGLFTPDRYLSLGLGLRSIRRSGRFTIDLEANPHVFLQEDELELGVWGIGELNATVGPLRVGVGAFGLGQTRGFGLGRFFGRVEFVNPSGR